MEPLPLPQIVKATSAGPHRDLIIIEPCFPGYGTTLANALRRVLLSSLPGAAVTSVRFAGASHEFSVLPGVKEDVVDIILNLKRLRFKVSSAEPVKVTLKVSGERQVTARDIKATGNAEVVNTGLHIATLTDKKAELEMELTVSQGRGYLPVESRDKESIELGAIAVDAIFTPMVRVGFNVEDVRVGQTTNFDKVTLDVETDGTVTPLEAVRQASKILVDHFSFIVNQETPEPEPAAPLAEEPAADGEETKRATKKRGRPKKEEPTS